MTLLEDLERCLEAEKALPPLAFAVSTKAVLQRSSSENGNIEVAADEPETVGESSGIDCFERAFIA